MPQADGVIEDSIYLNDTVVITEPVEKVGIIIDIGTTTVALKWLNLKSGMIIESHSFFNPQGKFGTLNGDTPIVFTFSFKNKLIIVALPQTNISLIFVDTLIRLNIL